MAPSAIELKLKCCRDVKAFNFFQKLSVYAVVSVVSEDLEKKGKRIHAHQKTPIDREGGGNPEWNHEIGFDLKDASLSNLELHQDNLFLEFQLLCEAIVFGDKTIGEVRVPIRDLVEESRGAVRFMSYQIRSGNGNPNGVLDFSYKVIDDEKKQIDHDDNNIVYRKIQSSDFQPSLYPPLPTIEACSTLPDYVNAVPEFGYPPRGIHYPKHEIRYPPPEQIHYESWEVHYEAETASPAGAPPHMVYPPPCSVVYPLGPQDPCGLSGSGGLDRHRMSAYPTKNDYFSEFQGSLHRGYVAGYRDVW